jgi:small GTP-binding protein
MLQKKICMLGAFAVGKTSLVARYVKSIFSEKYLTTVGVKIDKKEILLGSQEVNLILWDLAGEDEFVQLQTSYLKGSAGYILVADGTRSDTLLKAFTLQRKAEEAIGKVPFALVINKVDLQSHWEIDETALRGPREQGWFIQHASAKTGEGVEELFQHLTSRIMEEGNSRDTRT